MFLLYHAYVYLEFLILACTIYILAPIRLLRDAGFTWDANGDYWNHMYDAIQQVNESEATECWKKAAKLYVYSPAHELSKYQIRKLKEIGIEAASNSMEETYIVECLEQYHKNFGIRNLKYDYVIQTESLWGNGYTELLSCINRIS